MATAREKIDAGFESFGRWVYRNRIKTLLTMLVLIAAALSQLPNITSDTTNQSYFHKNDPTFGDFNAFRAQFGRADLAIVVVKPPNVFDPAFLTRLRTFHEALEQRVPYLDEVTSLVNVRNMRGEGDRLIVEDLLEQFPDTPEAMARWKQRVLASALYRNFLVSADGAITTVVIETLAHSPGNAGENLLAGFEDAIDAAPGTAPTERAPLTVEENRAVVQAVEAVIAEFDAPDFALHLAGGVPFDEFFERTMREDMGTFMGLAVLAIGAFLLLLFRRISGVVLTLAVVMFSVLSTVGLMAAAGVPFTIPSTILPSFLLAVGVGASVHLLVMFFQEFDAGSDKEAALAAALGHSGIPIVMTAMTTAAGLFSFATAAMAPIAYLGVFSGFGVLITLGYTLVLLPALLAVSPVRAKPQLAQRRGNGWADRFLVGIAAFSTKRAWGIVIVSALILAAAAGGLVPLRFAENFLAWLPPSLPLRQTSELIDRELKGSSNLEVVIDTGREDGLYEPAVMNGIEALAHFAMGYTDAAGTRLVSRTSSVVDVLKETHRALNENQEAFYTLPQGRELIAQELLLFENSGSDDMEKLVDSQFSKARLSLPATNQDFAVYIGFVDAVEREAARLFGDDIEVTITGSLNLFTQIMHTMMRTMLNSYTLAAAVITVMMIALIGSLRLGLLTMAVNFSPILITLGLVMGYAGIPLDTMTLLVGSIALGLAVDDTIHFFYNFRRYYQGCCQARVAVERTLLTAGRAMLFSTLVLVTGFWLFMFATLNNVANFGLLTGVTLIFALAADFLLAPALLELVTRTNYGRLLAERWSGAEVAAPSERSPSAVGVEGN